MLYKIQVSQLAIESLQKIILNYIDATHKIPTLKRVTDSSYVEQILKGLENNPNITKDVWDYLLELANSEIKRTSKAIGAKTNTTLTQHTLEMLQSENEYILLLCTTLHEEYKKEVARVINKGYIDGLSVAEMTALIKERIDISKYRAETIAITETAKINSAINRKLLLDNNIKKVTWSSAKDKRTRKCHTARHGKTYDIKKGCYSNCDKKHLQVGEEIRCRCAMLIEI
jgi:SPP1 gp7 family putative phage head morphogenesis protein